jgi:hypothetical protein
MIAILTLVLASLLPKQQVYRFLPRAIQRQAIEHSAIDVRSADYGCEHWAVDFQVDQRVQRRGLRSISAILRLVLCDSAATSCFATSGELRSEHWLRYGPIRSHAAKALAASEGIDEGAGGII